MKTKRSPFPCVALGLLLFLIYSNTFSSPWIFDDAPNIVDNAPLHIDNLMPDTLWHTFFAQPFHEGQLYRPVSCLSLALNWYVGQSNTIGYHIVNLFIHYCTALLLYLTILQLFISPRLADSYEEDSKYFIALLTAVLWAINPIQTQAVTYIVQRMASLATLFFILSFYFYIKGRLCKKHQLRYFFCCFTTFFLALGSKENTVLLPISLLLLEYTFFYTKNDSTDKKYLKILAGISVIICLTGIIYLFQSGIITNFFNTAGSRPFSYYERLLTESRIVFFYLSLIFYPIPARLSIDHDIVLSTSLFTPWTTFISILGIFILIILGFKQLRKRPLVGFSIIFFFLNQIVESTVIPLELIFEHRNYLPSLFLFLPIAAGIYSMLSYYSKHNKTLRGSIICFVILLIISVGIGTYIRNMAYATTETIWEDTFVKAPNSSRAYSKLGIIAGWEKKKTVQSFREAIALNALAMNHTLARTTFKPAILGNIGSIYFNYGLYDKAIEYYKKSLELNPRYVKSLYSLSLTYFKKGQFTLALEQINKVIGKSFPQSRYYNVQGLMYLWTNKPEKALISYRNAMYLLNNKKTAFYSIGTALSLTGNFRQARWFLKQAEEEERANMRIAFTVLENSIRQGDASQIDTDARYIFEHFTLSSIAAALQTLPTEYNSVPVDVKLLHPVIKKTADTLSIALFKK